MNCTDFEHSMIGLGSGEPPEQRALAHAGSCETCGVRLKQIEGLHSLLAQVARQDEAIETPGRVETALIEEFRAIRDPAPARMPLRRPVWTRPVWTRKVALVLGAAAMIALALAASIVYLRGTRDRAILSKHKPESPSVNQEANRVVPGGPPDAGAKIKPPLNPGTNPGTPVAIAPRPRRRPPGQIRSNRQQSPENGEIATDYFPMNYAAYLQPIDSGQIVRIRLPRSVLESYGVPVDPLRADEPINADVVIGNDGMARAIRFVR